MITKPQDDSRGSKWMKCNVHDRQESRASARSESDRAAQDRQEEDDAAGADSRSQSLSAVWAGPRSVSQVRHLPDLLPRHGEQGSDPGREEGKLVKAACGVAAGV